MKVKNASKILRAVISFLMITATLILFTLPFPDGHYDGKFIFISYTPSWVWFLIGSGLLIFASIEFISDMKAIYESRRSCIKSIS